MNKKLFCASPAPLLWNGLFVIVPLLLIAFIVIFSHMIFKMRENKKHHREAFNKQTKILALWSGVLFLSLVAYGIIGLNFDYYLLEFLLLTVFVLGAFYLGEHLKLFNVQRKYWIAVIVLTLIFATFFAICFIGSVNADAAFIQGVRENCPNRWLF